MDTENKTEKVVGVIERLVDCVGHIADNVWAFLLFGLAGALALAGHIHPDKDLMTFAGSVAMTGAALFHGKQKDQ
jgi:hypothetical protein